MRGLITIDCRRGRGGSCWVNEGLCTAVSRNVHAEPLEGAHIHVVSTVWNSSQGVSLSRLIIIETTVMATVADLLYLPPTRKPWRVSPSGTSVLLTSYNK